DGGTDDDTADGGTDDDTTDGGTDDDTSPTPDPAAVEDPCAEHEGREDDVFIDLVAPVDEQVVGEEVDIVGCSNVFEATIQWRLLDGDGATLEEGFTTAECGTGCVGAFSDTLPLSAFADEPVAHVQVYWQSPADGEGEEDLVERMVVLE
ncbi:MAG: Gmad2 immunoglobulin-like domain-containing protein, partial [Nitriliruptoraceae bacterium]